ncbi:hypothetical protein CVT26_013936 [Gymnopilus dilepis]|uniref:MutL C-terminal dimerisation domain-containing protein n=1 Tax=Gymnopilus dilepis TaxID=231916 RepID=A0A409VW01_9AGAR|nr:hypothetical protein CVT26_013936 [Gymnopilus dilepis]
MGSAQLSSVMNTVSGDPAQHASLQQQIDHQSTALYSTARLWDDGIIRPTDTRNIVGLGLALVSRERGSDRRWSSRTTWDGDGKGFGVFRIAVVDVAVAVQPGHNPNVVIVINLLASMRQDQPAVERLPLLTQTKLRSTQILTSFVQIVSELLQNSLDANATHVEVGLDCKEWTCWVSDNGCGISKEDLEALFQEGELGRYSGSASLCFLNDAEGFEETSKSYVPEPFASSSTFGFRGEALASAADISCLEICSRTAKSRNTWSIIVKGGQILYKGPAVRWKRESCGTTVCVRDAFYNLPVRRTSHTAPSRTWELVRQEVETYSLMFSNVSFRIEDTSDAGDPSRSSDHMVRIPKTSSTVGTFKYLYGSAMTEHVEEVNATDDINRHPITASDLSRVIESEFASSSFGKNALDEDAENNLPRSTIRRSPRKIEKRAVYVLNLSIAQERVDNCLQPSKSVVQLRDMPNVVAFLSATIRTFLKKHGFLNDNQLSSKRQIGFSPSPRKRKKPDFDDPECDSISEISELSIYDNRQASGIAVTGDLYTSVDEISRDTLWTDPTTGERFVVDLRTGNSFPQERRHRQAQDLLDKGYVVQQEGRRTLRQQNPSISARGDQHNCLVPVPSWLEQALNCNRAYALAESRIPSVELPPISRPIPSECHSLLGDKHGRHSTQKILANERLGVENLTSIYGSSTQEFTKDDIRHAEVINQVDRKFIACRIPKRSSGASSPYEKGDGLSEMDSVVVLIDQHAADERVRVERFLKELFLGFLYSQERTGSNQSAGVRTRELNPPRPVLLTLHEALTLERSQDVRELFRKWGLGFAELSSGIPDSDIPSGPGSTGYAQLLVNAIPEVVSDKGDELRDLVKGFLGQIQSGELFSDAGLLLPSQEDQENLLWFKAIRNCPRGLLDLVNSKACRGAIMFNDSLSKNQCEKLVMQLSETVFPFQCAHGRPSLVPLIETGQLQAGTHKRKKRRCEWKRLETMADV